ncbi:hypothetical protein KC360_g21 [Hortaea werneckii]|nr:hypothetical protein KC360_g21 [Hortaea werneckii]
MRRRLRWERASLSAVSDPGQCAGLSLNPINHDHLRRRLIMYIVHCSGAAMIRGDANHSLIPRESQVWRKLPSGPSRKALTQLRFRHLNRPHLRYPFSRRYATTGKRALASRIPTCISIVIISTNQSISLADDYRPLLPAITSGTVLEKTRLNTAHQHGRTASPSSVYARNPD